MQQAQERFTIFHTEQAPQKNVVGYTNGLINKKLRAVHPAEFL